MNNPNEDSRLQPMHWGWVGFKTETAIFRENRNETET